jgi:hypothetical protein
LTFHEDFIQRKSQNSHEKEQVGGLTLPDFKTQYRVTINRMVWHWHRDGQRIRRRKGRRSRRKK